MGYLLTNHERTRPYSAVMLGPRRNPVNSLVGKRIQAASCPTRAQERSARAPPALPPRVWGYRTIFYIQVHEGWWDRPRAA